MDAREAQKWLEDRLKAERLIEAEQRIQGKLERAPIAELQYLKLLVLHSTSFGSNYTARTFVHDMLADGCDALITRNQSEYIEALWHRYRKQHWMKSLPEPFTEIMRFNRGIYTIAYDCKPENEAYTVTFHDPDETTFF